MSDWIEAGTRRWSREAGGLLVVVEMDYDTGVASWTVDQSGKCVASGRVEDDPVHGLAVTELHGGRPPLDVDSWRPPQSVDIEEHARFWATQNAAAVAEAAFRTWQALGPVEERES